MSNYQNNPEFSEFFFSQLPGIVESSFHTRECPVYEDIDWIRHGVERVLENNKSGRDFIQSLQDFGADNIKRSNFFAALSSSRRALLAQEVNERFIQSIGINSHTLFDDMPELDNREIHAIDGHHIAHGCHAPKAYNDKGELKFLTSHILYDLNLRNNMISPFAIAGNYQKKEHEVTALKREVKSLLKRGKKSLWTLDRAYFDARFWDDMRKQSVYVILRLKENVKPIMRHELHWDRSDPINIGVINYEWV